MLQQSRKDATRAEADRSELEAAFRQAIEQKLTYDLGKSFRSATDNDWYHATALAVRDRIVTIWMESRRETKRAAQEARLLSIDRIPDRPAAVRRPHAISAWSSRRSARSPASASISTGCAAANRTPRSAMAASAASPPASWTACRRSQFPPTAMASVTRTACSNNASSTAGSTKSPEDWLAPAIRGSSFARDSRIPIGFGGSRRIYRRRRRTDRTRALVSGTSVVLALPYDTPIAGWRGRHVNTLRLWSARAADPIQLAAFNRGDLVGATAARARAEAISRVLYPNDAHGRRARNCGCGRSISSPRPRCRICVRRHIDEFGSLDTLPDHAAIQLNDTHPAIAVAETDAHPGRRARISWDKAWAITRATLSYTNHTLLPEALETWPVELLGRLLPRHLQIIYRSTGCTCRRRTSAALPIRPSSRNVSLIHEDGERRVRMAHLAFVGSHAVNGVSALHTDLLRGNVFHDLARLDEDPHRQQDQRHHLPPLAV